MNVRSKFDTDKYESTNSRDKYIRGGCGAPYALASGPTRLDVSMLRVPRFIESAFEALGWKTRSQKPSKCQE